MLTALKIIRKSTAKIITGIILNLVPVSGAFFFFFLISCFIKQKEQNDFGFLFFWFSLVTDTRSYMGKVIWFVFLHLFLIFCLETY